MPATPPVSYPGVYVQEVPSGVRTIVGVSTSITAFVGTAKFGPINRAVKIYNYGDFERNYGGLIADNHLGYAVRQFFANGGSEAWIVRVAKDPAPAYREFLNSSTTKVLKITAKDPGREGNLISVVIDHETSNPASTFNLMLQYAPTGRQSEVVSETFSNLTMNSEDARYVETVVNGSSRLIQTERIVDPTTITDAGTSISAPLSNIDTLLDDTHNQFRISVNGSEPVDIKLDPNADIAGADDTARLRTLCAAIKREADRAKASNPAFIDIACDPDNGKIKITSAQAGETSSVRVLPGTRNDAARNLKLGTENGGEERDAVALIRPVEIPAPGTLESGALTGPSFTASPTVPGSDGKKFQICLDGGEIVTVDIGDTALLGNVDAKGAAIAVRITDAVKKVRQNNPSYSNFRCTYDPAANKLKLSSGSRGYGSSVLILPDGTDVLARRMKLLVSEGAVATPGIDALLSGGNDLPVMAAGDYNVYIGNPAQREGIYALEDVDIFNILCLPGVTHSGILADADAYCRKRRAFMIADPPRGSKSPADMVDAISGTTLPKTEYGSVYYPWLKIADPLKGGRIGAFPPSGTIAGLYARTDSSRGVWKAPAGTEATLTGVQGVEYALTDQENGTLNKLGVNCIRVFPVYGCIAWGARTLRGADQMTSEYKYIPVRRLALYLEESLYRGLKWVVFEPNDEPLWAQIRLNVGAFMHNLFRQGAFQGKSPREAYFVRCDSETTTQNDINLGIVNIWVGFAPLKPAEFVVIYLQQMAGQIET